MKSIRALAAVVLVWGGVAIATQSLLLREALVLMYGSELAWGLVLFAWLAGVAIGALISGLIVARTNSATAGPGDQPFGTVLLSPACSSGCSVEPEPICTSIPASYCR